VAENMTENKGDSKIVTQIRGNSRRLARTRREVEQDIASRSFGEINIKEAPAASSEQV
jgi:hypothetical protein